MSETAMPEIHMVMDQKHGTLVNFHHPKYGTHSGKHTKSYGKWTISNSGISH
jgi:hypothetical protein